MADHHYQPVSGISIEGDVAAGQKYVPRAKAMLRRLQDRVKHSHSNLATDHVRLDDDAYCYAIVTKTIHRAVIVVSATGEELEAIATPTIPDIPDFYSGAITSPYITKPPVDPITGITPAPYINAFWPTVACAALFKLSPNVQTSTRLAIDVPTDLTGIGPPEDYSGPLYSQYTKLKPTMYSGVMCGVVQLLMGFGKQIKKSIYDKTQPILATPAQQRQLKNNPTPYQSAVKKNGLQIHYDWRWYKTHGIGVGSDGKLWLVEIGNTRGAIAMPLPTNSVVDNNLDKFRLKLGTLNDDAGTYVLDRYNCLPTGEGFPTTSDIDHWIRSGRVVRLATVDEMQEFYDLGAPSSFYGWAFNMKGDEAHNIGTDYGDNGYLRYSHYGFSFSIGNSRNVAETAASKGLKAAISSKSGDSNYAANVWKCDALSPSQIQHLIDFNDGVDDLYAQLDALTAAPVATCSGHLWLDRQGYLYKEGKAGYTHYEVKFPQPEIGYLVSVDMTPEIGASRTVPMCDTDVHVFFLGDELKTVRYFCDPRATPAVTVTDDTDGCELAGTFTHTTQTGNVSNGAMVYSTDFDDRTELVGSRSISIYVGKDMGYSSVQVGDNIINPTYGQLTRTKRFRFQLTTESWTGEGITSACIVPFLDRQAYYYALGKSFIDHSKSISYGYKYHGDPWSCPTWRNFPGYTGQWIDLGNGNYKLVHLAQHPDGCGPVTARTVMSPGATYGGDACSDECDQGAWCFICDNADAMTYNIPEPPVPAATNVTDPQTATRWTWITAASSPDDNPMPVPIEVAKVFTGTFTSFSFPWFTPSPDAETMTYQYAEETHNAFGTGTVMRYDSAPNAGSLARGEPQPPDFADSNTTFIGVVP